VYKGYLKGNGKHAASKFKDGSKLLPYYTERKEDSYIISFVNNEDVELEREVVGERNAFYEKKQWPFVFLYVKVGDCPMYEWLKDYQRLEEEISYLEFNLEQSERELKRWVIGDLSGVKLQAESDGAKLEERIDRIKKDLAEKKDQKQQLVRLVSSFKGLDHKVLKLKYIDGLTLEEIAEHLNYSSSHIKKKHAELVRTIKFVEELKI